MDYEYAPLRLPSNVDRGAAAAQLAIQAEFSGWELARVQLFRDGNPPGDAPPKGPGHPPTRPERLNSRPCPPRAVPTNGLELHPRLR